MRLTLPAMLVLSSFALAQAPNNRHFFYPGEGAAPNYFFTGTTVATRMGYATTQDVEIFSDLSAGAFRGIGAASQSSCKVTGQYHVVQDGDQTTANPYKVILRRAVAPDGLPDTTAAGVIAISNPVSTPLGTGTGGVAWAITLTWQTPITIPCENGFYIGIELLPETSTTDVTVTHAATTFAATAGDNPRLPTPKFHAVSVAQPGAIVLRTPTVRTVAIVALTDAATLNVGNVDGSAANYKSYGIGGLYPAVKSGTRDDGLSVRIQDGSSPGGLCAIFMAADFFPGGIPLGSFTGAVWVNPAILINMGGGTIPAAAPYVLETTVATPGSIPAVKGLKLAFTAAVVNLVSLTGRFTNAQMVSM